MNASVTRSGAEELRERIQRLEGAAAVLFTAGVAVHTRGTVLWCITRPDLFAPSLAQGRGLGTSVGISPRLPTDESNSNDGSLASAE